MIWHVWTEEFVRFLKAEGFQFVGQTDRFDLYRRGSTQIAIRRTDRPTQAEVDRICDAADLDPPKMDSFFGD